MRPKAADDYLLDDLEVTAGCICRRRHSCRSLLYLLFSSLPFVLLVLLVVGIVVLVVSIVLLLVLVLVLVFVLVLLVLVLVLLVLVLRLFLIVPSLTLSECSAAHHLPHPPRSAAPPYLRNSSTMPRSSSVSCPCTTR